MASGEKSKNGICRIHNWTMSCLGGTEKEILSIVSSLSDFECCKRLSSTARTFTPPSISICRTVTSRYASDGVFTIRIEHTGDETRSAIYSELWPWWVKGWLHEITMTQIGHGLRRESPSCRLQIEQLSDKTQPIWSRACFTNHRRLQRHQRRRYI